MTVTKHSRIVFLTYHSVDDSGSVISVSSGMFEKQLQYLQAQGYQSFALKDALKSLKGLGPMPQKAVVLTFDDGYQNNLTHALPLLQKYGFTATIFITTNRCGRMNDWTDQHRSIPLLAMLSWDEIATLDQAGIDIGAHTQNHPKLSQIALPIAEEEIRGAQKILEDKLGHAVPHFAYPYGLYNAEVRDIVEKTFEGAISTIPGRPTQKSDPFVLERINGAGKIFRMLPLSLLGANQFAGYLFLKSAVMRLRGRGLH